MFITDKPKLFMRREWNMKAIIVIIMALGLILSGCAQSYRAEIYSIPSYLVTSQFGGSGSVSIKNEAPKGSILLGGPYGAGVTFWGDLQQITDTAISLLSGELHNRGFLIEKNASKLLKLKVIETKIIQAMNTQCAMQLYIETGDGYKRVYYT